MNNAVLSSIAVAPLLVISSFGVHFASKHVETVADMKHGVAVDAVVASIATGVGVHPSLIVALLLEEVVEVECHDKSFTAEESLGYLSIPNQFVCVHGGVVVAATAMFANVGAHLESCWKSEEHLAAIAELPCVEVGIRL